MIALTLRMNHVHKNPMNLVVLAIALPVTLAIARSGESPAEDHGVAPGLSGKVALHHEAAEAPPSPAPPRDEFAERIQPFLKTWCFECHSGDDAEAGVDLSRFDSGDSVRSDAETWDAVIDALDSDFMPPDDAPQPAADEVSAVLHWYAKLTADADGAETPLAIMRRLNRVEYENTVRDLLRLKVDVFDNPARLVITDDYFQPATGRMPRYVLAMSHHTYSRRKPPELPGISELPVDPPVEHGFSNDQSALSCSPVHLEAFLSLAGSILNDSNFPRHSLLWNSLFTAEGVTNESGQIALARQRLETFLPRAFRRPVTSGEVDRYTDLFARELVGGDFTSAMKSVVTAVLASPSFLFRRDRTVAAGADGEVDPYAMASRLSYFLWASMPDEELFQAAAEGRLRTDVEIDWQVRRMMADRRIKALSTDFGMQWLQVARIHSARPDADQFPGWYLIEGDGPGVSMAIEQLLLFETIMVEDRSILEFVHADFAYLNRVLMDWYYIDPADALGYTPPADAWEDYFRVRWPNEHRGGAITSGAMLASTSATTRTSPVYRGAWILEVAFNRPPPPPPPDVPALDSPEESRAPAGNIRDRLAQHRDQATCAVCHDRIDPIGFALEKFDPVGRFRKNYEDGAPIDAAGTMYGEEFDGAARFKNVLLRQKERFVAGFVEHVAQYALGRELQPGDRPELEQIARALAAEDYRFSAVFRAVARSELFRAVTPGNPAVNVEPAP